MVLYLLCVAKSVRGGLHDMNTCVRTAGSLVSVACVNVDWHGHDFWRYRVDSLKVSDSS